MALQFRPYPGVTVAAVIATAILIGLGVWQLQRLQWKLALIAEVNGHMTAPPLPLSEALKDSADAMQYRRVALEGRFDNAKEAYVFTTAAGGEAVYHVLTPFLTDDGHSLLVDRGYVPKEKLDPATRTPVEGATRLVGVWRVPDAPGAFTPAADMAHRIWYSRDLKAIAAADHIQLAAPVIVEADAAPNPGGWPKGGQTVVSFRNEHLSYAVTWFGLAASLLGVYFAYHVSKGRLRWA
ncbi:MAG: SURF1 family protein [Alphaproteobacteria bacterium]|nr:SURF1 family protein [Alphaproteobacteria bacterium]